MLSRPCPLSSLTLVNADNVAIMSTCDSQLLVVASSLVRDFRGSPSTRGGLVASRVTVFATVVAAVAMSFGAKRVVDSFVLASWGALGAAFGPVLIALLYRRRTSAGAALAGIVTGAAVAVGWQQLPLVDGEKHCLGYRYCPRSCRFVRVDLQVSHPHHFAGVLTCWASDLAALFQGVFEPRAMVRSWRESWIPNFPYRFMTNILWPFFHPLRHPQRTLTQYRAKYAAVGYTIPAIKGAAKQPLSQSLTEGENADVLR